MPGTTIESSPYNSTNTDIASALTDSLSRSGDGGMLADLLMGGFKVSGMGTPTVGDDAATKDYVDSSGAGTGSGAVEVTVASATTTDVLGAASVFVLVSGTTTITSLGTGTNRLRYVRFSGSLTLTHNATTLILPGAANIITQNGDVMVMESDSVSNVRVLSYVPAASATTLGLAPLTVASATTCDILGANSPLITISGTTTVTSLGTGTYRVRFVTFSGALLLTHNGTSLILPGAANITTAAGDTCVVTSDASSNARVLAFQRASGAPLNGATTSPQGRLTLTTAVPVLVSDVTAATSIYYTPYVGLSLPIYNGTSTVMTSTGGELTLALDSNSGHTGYQQADKNFDLFVYNDSGTVRLVSGPAWTSDTARSSALEYKNGFLCNAASMAAKYDTSSSTLTIAQDLATYVGTFRASANGQTTWVANPGGTVGGGDCKLYLWNMYNRVDVSSLCVDSTDTWTYTTATVRAKNNSNANRISVLRGLDQDAVECQNAVLVGNFDSSAKMMSGIGIDSTSAVGANVLAGFAPPNTGVGNSGSAIALYNGLPGVGFHFYQALEWSAAVSTTTWGGDNGGGSPLSQSGLIFRMRA